jgi:uncharacterized RDD family membrane protein YckC
MGCCIPVMAMEGNGESEDQKLDLKENLVRRAIALTIDHAVLSVMATLVGGFIISGMFFGNPLAVFFGLPAAFLLKSANSMGAEPVPLLYMIALVLVFFILSMLYFSIFESNGRRTPGKALMHLEVLNEEGFFPGFVTVMKRTLIKSISGALACYFLGLLGAGLAMGLVSLFDLKASPSKKGDLRQRSTEVWAGTVVLLEDDEAPYGSITSFVGDWKKDREEKEIKRMKLPSFGRKEKGPGVEKKRMRLFSKKDKVLKEERGPLEDLTAPMLAPKSEQPGGTPSLKDETTEPISDARSKELEKEEAVLRLMIDLEIDENRARALTDAGYRSRVDLTDAIPQDLIQVKGINPTMAKKMIEKAKAPLPQ